MATIRSREQIMAANQKLKAQIEKKHGKTVEEIYAEREKRVRDAIELRVPDRVPVTVFTGTFAARHAGLPLSSQYYNQAAYYEACKQALIEYEPDTGGAAVTANSGTVLDLLDSRHQKWPGGNLPEDLPYQFVEGEYMKPEEYDWFLSDPSDFIVRGYLPRVYGTLAPLAKLPPLRTMTGTGFSGLVGLFARPEFVSFAEKLYKAGQAQQKAAADAVAFSQEMQFLGFPSADRGRSAGGSPFDAVSDFLRGMRGAMLDMYRCPDKLLQACDNILKWRIALAEPAPKGKGIQRGGSPLHRGSDGFMSIKQFETFYWPDLKKAALVSIDLGYIVANFYEGVWDQRLEYFFELPKGKAIFHCEKTDVFRAKEIIGNHMCIQGGVPVTLLETGSPQEVEEHCKKLIKTVGKGGGYIMGVSTASEGAKPENVRAMVESVKKYGWY